MIHFCLPLLIMTLLPLLCPLLRILKKIKIMWSKFWAVDSNSGKTINVNFTRKQRNYHIIQDTLWLRWWLYIYIKKIKCSCTFRNDFSGWWNLDLLYTIVTNIHEKACKRLNILTILKRVIDRNFFMKIYFAFIYTSKRSCLYDGLGWEPLHFRRIHINYI